jgi:hypothetical protein
MKESRQAGKANPEHSFISYRHSNCPLRRHRPQGRAIHLKSSVHKQIMGVQTQFVDAITPQIHEIQLFKQ